MLIGTDPDEWWSGRDTIMRMLRAQEGFSGEIVATSSGTRSGLDDCAHNSLVRKQVRAHGGFEVGSHGDGFLIAFSSARRALEFAVALQRAFETREEEGPAIRLRIGLHTGEPIRDSGDFYGTAVNYAARVAERAGGGEILVSGLVRALTESAGGFAFGEERTCELKGFSGSHAVFPVRWGG